MFGSLGRLLIAFGVLFVVVGAVILLLGRFVRLGHLPLDLRIERERWAVYFPIGTMLLVSLVLTIVLNIVLRLRR